MSSKSVQDSLRRRFADVWSVLQEEFPSRLSFAKDIFLGSLVTAILESTRLLTPEGTAQSRMSKTNAWLQKFGIEPVHAISSLAVDVAEKVLEDTVEVVEAQDLPLYRLLDLSYDWAGQLRNRKSGVHYTNVQVVHLMCKVAIASMLASRMNLGLKETVTLLDEEIPRSKTEIIQHILSGKKFTDPASGSGAFLHGILDVVAEVGHRHDDQQFLLQKILPNFSAVELDPWGVRLTKFGLLLRFKDNLDQASQLQVYRGDYLLPGIVERIGPVDVVIGNPPYVRNELMENVIWGVDERQPTSPYKEQISREARRNWPNLRLDRRADLYVYFFLRGLWHLHPRGVLCLITSNSWLDSKYGAFLREWLLRNSKILCVLSWTTRSFRADIDPVVSAVVKTERPVLEPLEAVMKQSVLFVSLPAPSYPLLRDALSQQCDLANSPQGAFLSAVAKPQIDLYRELQHGEAWAREKWGGRFLRAPKVYRQIFERRPHVFTPLGRMARIRSGIHSRANDFFILRRAASVGAHGRTLELVNSQLVPGNPISIEQKFLRPIITSPRLYPTISIEQTDYFVLTIDIPKESLERLQVFQYVQLAEQRGVPNRPELSKRVGNAWYKVYLKDPGPILMPKVTRDKHRVHYNPHLLFADGNFYSAIPSENVNTAGLLLYLNSSLAALSREVIGRTNVLGALKVEGMDWASMPIPQAEVLKELAERFDGFESFVRRPIQPIELEVSNQDRNALDEMLLNILEIDISIAQLCGGLISTRKQRSLKESHY